MRRRAPLDYGAYGLSRQQRLRRRGFTLLEICTVLFIIAIFIGVMMPAMQSVFVEKAVRDDAQRLSLMVKTAMLQSADQNRNYIIELTSNEIALHPEGNAFDKDANTDIGPSLDNEGDPGKNPAVRDFIAAGPFDKSNKLLVPDPEKPDGWVGMPATFWIFKPGQLCPATRVRLSRGDAWIEMSFNALTGNVENESDYFP